MAFSTFMMLYNHHVSLVLKHFCHPQSKPYTFKVVSTPFSSPETLETISLLSVSVDLPLLEISYKWNPVMWHFVSSFIRHIFKSHCQHFISFDGWIIFNRVCLPLLLIHSSIDGHTWLDITSFLWGLQLLWKFLCNDLFEYLFSIILGLYLG